MAIEGRREPWRYTVTLSPEGDPGYQIGEFRFLEIKQPDSLRPTVRRRVRVIAKDVVAGMIRYRFEGAPLPADPA